MGRVVTAHVELADGRDFVAEIANLTPFSLFVHTAEQLSFRAPVTVTFFSVSIRAELAIVTRQPAGWVVVFSPDAETRARIEARIPAVSVLEGPRTSSSPALVLPPSGVLDEETLHALGPPPGPTQVGAAVADLDPESRATLRGDEIRMVLSRLESSSLREALQSTGGIPAVSTATGPIAETAALEKDDSGDLLIEEPLSLISAKDLLASQEMPAVTIPPPPPSSLPASDFMSPHAGMTPTDFTSPLPLPRRSSDSSVPKRSSSTSDFGVPRRSSSAPDAAHPRPTTPLRPPSNLPDLPIEEPSEIEGRTMPAMERPQFEDSAPATKEKGRARAIPHARTVRMRPTPPPAVPSSPTSGRTNVPARAPRRRDLTRREEPLGVRSDSTSLDLPAVNGSVLTDIPVLADDESTVLFASPAQYLLQHRTNIAHGAIVVRSRPIPIGTEKTLHLSVPGMIEPYTLHAKVILSTDDSIGLSIDHFDEHAAALEALTQ